MRTPVFPAPVLTFVHIQGHETEERQKLITKDESFHSDNGCCGNVHCGVSIKTLDALSAFISFGCLCTSLVWWWSGSDNPTVNVNRELLLYSRQHDTVQSMRYFHSTVNDYCDNHKMQLLQPSWGPMSDKEYDGVSMMTQVYATKLYLWPIVIWIYLWSSTFQFVRYKQFGNLYRPDLGPEYSRWLEYFFTSPCQILIVALSFGFATSDSLIGFFHMQAALVLLGYNIEQQIKKIYKRPFKDELVKEPRKKMYNIFHPHIHDIRLPVYLIFAWMLHLFIWGLPAICFGETCLPSIPWGIGGRYQLQKDHNVNCEKDEDWQIPFFVDFIFWGQFLSFTLFGIVCTAQVLNAKSRLDEFVEDYKQTYRGKDLKEFARTYAGSRHRPWKWERYTKIYSILSVTAKTLLEVGFLGFVANYSNWKEISGAKIDDFSCFNLNEIQFI